MKILVRGISVHMHDFQPELGFILFNFGKMKPETHPPAAVG